MVANILPADAATNDPGVKKLKFNLSENGHVAYQIKGNCKCSNMVANVVRSTPSQPLGLKVKIQHFQNMIRLHIKLKGIADATTQGSKYFAQSPNPAPQPRGPGQNSTFRTWSCCISKGIMNAATWYQMQIEVK